MTEIIAEAAGQGERRVRERRRRGWAEDFRLEDLILYVFGAVIVFLFWSMFGQVQTREQQLTASTSSAVEPWKPVQGEQLRLAHMKAQVALAGLRYQQAARTSAAISTRRDFGFLIGAILALLGSIIAIRGSRGETIDASLEAGEYAKLKIATTTSGVAIAVLGAAIVLATVLNNDHSSVEDKGIALAGADALTPMPTTTTQTTTANPDVRALVNALDQSAPAPTSKPPSKQTLPKTGT